MKMISTKEIFSQYSQNCEKILRKRGKPNKCFIEFIGFVDLLKKYVIKAEIGICGILWSLKDKTI